MKDAILARARDLGFDACRVTSAAPPASAGQFLDALREGRHGEMHWLARNADKRVDPRKVLPGAQSILTLAISYGGQARQGPAGRACEVTSPAASGIVARYARYSDYHDVIGDRLRDLAVCIDGLGGPGTRSLGYLDTGPVLERDLAQRAGLGFVGKHTGLVSRSLGNWFLIGEILTTLELEPDPPEPNHCGRCTRCIDACPTGALPAPFKLDARRCIAYLTIELRGPIPEEFRPLVGSRIFGCDDCLEACPWNRFAKEASLMRPHARPELGNPALVELLGLDEETFRTRFRGTPMARSKRRGLLRNVCVALGNVGTCEALPALWRAAQDPEPLIAAHALWAIRRIESRAGGKGVTAAASD